MSSFVSQMEEIVSDVVSADVFTCGRLHSFFIFWFWFVLIFESSGSQVGHDPKEFVKKVCGQQGDLKNAEYT